MLLSVFPKVFHDVYDPSNFSSIKSINFYIIIKISKKKKKKEI
jgi:hypothetical protein